MLDVELAIQNWTDVMINRYRKTKKGNPSYIAFQTQS